jgi:cobalt-zinc-cadmium efflux system membrane fusion protein
VIRSTLPKHIVLQAAAALLLTTAAVAGIYRMQHAQDAPAAAPARPGSDIVFDANAPQLTAIISAQVFVEAIPLAPPQAARVAYNERQTARVSAAVAGRMTQLRADTGDLVRHGQILAQLDAPDMATAEADFDKARADELRKARAAERARILFDGQVLAAKDLESAQADLAQARAETRRAQLRLRNLNATEGNNGLFDLKAPIDGMVTERQTNPGQEVRPDLATPLFVISNLAQPWVLVDVPEQLALALRVGQAALVESDTWPGERFPATIDHIAPMLDPATRRMQVRCVVKNGTGAVAGVGNGHGIGKLRPEMFVRVSFVDRDAQSRAVVVPNASIFADGRYSAVFVQLEPGRFRKRRVTILRTVGERSYIGTGLVEGEQVVTDGAFLLTTESGDAHPAG